MAIIRYLLRPGVRRDIRRKSRPSKLRLLEDRYGTYLRMQMNTIWKLVERDVIPNLDRWMQSIQGRRDALRVDDEFEQITQTFNRMRVTTHEQETPWSSQVRRTAETMASAVNSQNEQRTTELLGRVLRVDPFQAEQWLVPMARNWITENVSLVKSVAKSNLDDLEQTLFRMLREGASKQETVKALRDKFNLTKYRANLIARDQVNKFNGDLTRERQTRMGINEYIWRTMDDQRVRGRPGGAYPKAKHSHWDMEGVRCRWDDPTVHFNGKKWVKRTANMPKVHPGQEIQCRCYAEPVLEEVA